MENLPKDPVMLLSAANTKLRDLYPTLEALCGDLGIEKESLTETLARLDYRYSPEKNQFIPMDGKPGN